MKIKITTVNDDFTDRVTDVPYYAARRHVVAVQEGKNTDYRRILSDYYGVQQSGGAAVVWQKNFFKEKGRGVHPLITNPRVRMETREIVWIDLKRKKKTIRYASAHNAPPRYSSYWDEAEKNFRKFIESSPYPVVIGMDANRIGGPRGMGRLVRWKGKKIDGWLYSKSIKLRRVYTLPLRKSDHRAVRALVIY